MLLAIAQYFAPSVAIPIQGGIQLVANGSRVVILREHVAWRVVAKTLFLLFPGALLGVAFASSLPEDALRVALGVFVLIVAWRPELLRFVEAGGPSTRTLVVLGGLSGFSNTTLGVSGPIAAPILKAATATHIAFVATAACVQVAGHTAKLIAFGLDGFAFGDHIDTVAAGAVAVVVGNWVGSRLLNRIGATSLDTVFRGVLTALAVRLLVQAVL